MRVLILPLSHAFVIAIRDASELPSVLAYGPWAGCDVALTAQDAYEGSPPPPLKPEDFIDRSKPVPQVPGAKAVAKIEFYRRCTDQEVGQIQALLADTGPKMTAIFDACVYFRSDAPEWQMLMDATVGLFGAERAAVLLAPSE